MVEFNSTFGINKNKIYNRCGDYYYFFRSFSHAVKYGGWEKDLETNTHSSTGRLVIENEYGRYVTGGINRFALFIEGNFHIEKETELSKFNSKTLKMDEYKKFITNKNKLNNNVKTFYNNILFRKLNFRRLVRTKQSEENLLNEIENKFLTKDDKINNKKILLLYGDYSRTSQMKGTIPAPNIGFKKLLLKRFEILEVNEYNTSKLYNKTFKELENVSVRKNKHKKHLHEILTPKEETERCIFVNRDKMLVKIFYI
jgi:hypothetical protein